MNAVEPYQVTNTDARRTMHHVSQTEMHFGYVISVGARARDRAKIEKT